jgi:hypothetical protein
MRKIFFKEKFVFFQNERTTQQAQGAHRRRMEASTAIKE